MKLSIQCKRLSIVFKDNWHVIHTYFYTFIACVYSQLWLEIKVLVVLFLKQWGTYAPG